MTFMAANATIKARALKDVWNLAVVIPVDKGMEVATGGSNRSSNGSVSGELVPEENFLAICSRELLARSCELLKKMRQCKNGRILAALYAVVLLETIFPFLNSNIDSGPFSFLGNRVLLELAGVVLVMLSVLRSV